MIWLLFCALLWWSSPVLAEFRCAGSQGSATAALPAGAAAKPARVAASTTGTRQALVLFARFKGEPANPVPSWAADLFNPELPGSFSHFYDTMSFGKLQVRGEVGPRVYESLQPASAYLADDQTPEEDFGRFSLEILRQADQGIDFGQSDNDGPDGVPNSGDDDGVADAVFLVLDQVPTDFLVSEATGIARLGFGEAVSTRDPGVAGEMIRVLASQGTIQQGRSFAETVGSICHEYGHVLGLPDLYNTEFLGIGDAGPEEDSAGVGAWCLMGWGATGWKGSDGPNSFCAWSRAKLGWAEVAEVKKAQQAVRLRPVGQRGQILKVPITGQEYFLAEYRRRRDQHYDRNIPGEGMLIWHVRRRPDQGEQYPYEIDLECADGRWQDAGFPQGKTPDPQAGGDNLDFWAHDAKYTWEHAGNLGDATDPFDGVHFVSFTPATNPASFDGAGVLSARIEGITLGEEVATAQVQTSPLLVEVRKLALGDKGSDGLVLAGEELKLSFQLANTGGLEAPEVKTRLRTDDPLVEVLQAETQFGALGLGKVIAGSGSGFPTFRFRGGFFGAHTATLILEVWVDGTLVEERQIEVPGVSPRQKVSRVVVVDPLGNRDGAAQAGEFIHLQLELENAADPSLLRFFTFLVHALNKEVVQVGGAQFQLAADQGQPPNQRTPEFLISSRLEPGTRLQFEFEAHSGFSAWRDTFAIELHPGPDQTPPRVLALQTRSVPDGVWLVLPQEAVWEGGEVRKAEAILYAAADTSQLAMVPLRWQGDRYEGKWSTRQSGTYLAAGAVEDGAGNQGQSRLQGFSVFAGDAGQPIYNPWEALGLPGAEERPSIDDLVLAPGNPEVMYAPTSQGLWRSGDFGKTWVRTGLMQDARILVDAVDPFALYTDTGLKSRDGGMNWEGIGASIRPIATDPVRPGRLYGDEGGYLAISEDRGQTWTTTEVEAGDFVAVHPANPSVLCVGRLRLPDQLQSRIVPGDLWRSADGGRTWDRQRLEEVFQTITIDPHSPEGLYGARRDTIFHSPDRGTTWEQRGVLGSQNPSMRLAVHPRDPRLLYAWPGSSVELWRTLDAGQTWEQVILPEYQWVSQVILYPTDPHRILVVTVSFRAPAPLLLTRDDGETWEEIHLPQTSPVVGTVAFDATGTLYVGAGRKWEGGNMLPSIYTSADQGHSWNAHGEKVGEIGYFTSGPVWTELLYMDPQQPQTWIAGMNGIFERSTDGGKSWKWLASVWGSGDLYPVLVTDPRQAGVYFLTAAGSIWRSADFGETWEKRVTGLQSDNRFFGLPGGLVMDPADPPTLYTAVNDKIYRSRDEGLHWEQAGGFSEEIQVLALNSSSPQRLYAATREGLYASADRGGTWSLLLVNPEPALPVRMRLRFDPHEPARMLWVTGPALLETWDGGETWEDLGEGLASVPWFNDAAVDPLNNSMVYTATPWGVYRLDTSKRITAVEEGMETAPLSFALDPNYPNPFNPTTAIRFSLSQRGEAELAIYNLLGQRVATLVKGVQEAGPQVLQWNGRDAQGRELASGVYLYRLQAGAQVETRKLLLLR